MSLLTRALLPTATPARPAEAGPTSRRSILGGFGGGSSGVRVGGTPDSRSASAVVYRCVQTIANPLAALDVFVADRDGAPVEGHPIANLLNRRPNPTTSAYVLKSVMWQRLEYRGEAFLYLDRGDSGTGDPEAVWPIYGEVAVVASRPARVNPLTGAQVSRPGDALAWQLDGFVVTLNGKRVPLLASEVLWLRYPHPDEPFGALAPWRAAMGAAELDTYARSWQHAEYLNGARPEGIFYLGDVDKSTHDATVEAWRSRHVGARNALKHLFVSGPEKATYTRVGLTPAEMSYLESRKANADEVMLAFGVPHDLLRGGATYENQRAAKTNLWTELLLPKLEVVSAEADRQLVPEDERMVRFDVSQVEALREGQDAIVGRVQDLAYTDTMLVDESREAVGLPPLPNGRGQRTLTAFRQAELDALPGALTEAQETTAVRVGRARVGDDGTLLDAAPTAPGPTSSPARRQAVLEHRAKRKRDAAAVLKAYDRGEARGRRSVVQLGERQERVVMRKLAALEGKRARAGVRVQADDLFDAPYWRSFTSDLFEPWLLGVWETGADLTGRSLGIDLDVYDEQVRSALYARLQVLADVVTETTRQAIDSELLAIGAAEGDGERELGDRLRAHFTDLQGWRADTIARTESIGGHNAASRTTVLASGITVVREWLATSDDRTRDTHADLDGHRTSGVNDPYPNGVMFPGDPNGAAKETVNCRCVELFLEVEQP